MTNTNRVANILDLTHGHENVGSLDSAKMRYTLARWLDGAIKMKSSTIRMYCKYLEMIARHHS